MLGEDPRQPSVSDITDTLDIAHTSSARWGTPSPQIQPRIWLRIMTRKDRALNWTSYQIFTSIWLKQDHEFSTIVLLLMAARGAGRDRAQHRKLNIAPFKLKFLCLASCQRSFGLPSPSLIAFDNVSPVLQFPLRSKPIQMDEELTVIKE